MWGCGDMRAPWTSREHGGRDMRLLTMAAGMWAAALAATPLMQPHNARTLIIMVAILICAAAGVVFTT